jgi:peptidoglycan hydrolase CwlO-like protein
MLRDLINRVIAFLKSAIDNRDATIAGLKVENAELSRQLADAEKARAEALANDKADAEAIAAAKSAEQSANDRANAAELELGNYIAQRDAENAAITAELSAILDGVTPDRPMVDIPPEVVS